MHSMQLYPAQNAECTEGLLCVGGMWSGSCVDRYGESPRTALCSSAIPSRSHLIAGHAVQCACENCLIVSPADALRSCGMSGKPFVCTAWRSISSMCCPSWGSCSIWTSEGTVDRFMLSKAEPKSCMSGGDQPSGCRGDCEFSVGVPSSSAGERQHQAFGLWKYSCLLTLHHNAY